MTQRSILAGQTPTVIVHAGADVHVEGWDNERVQAETQSHAGLKVERRSEADLARERAKVGEHVLFDIRLKKMSRKHDVPSDAIEVQIGGNGRVHVPLHSTLKVYAGRSADVQNIQGEVAASVGRNLSLHQVQVLVHAASGWSMDLDCDRLVKGDDFKFAAGRYLRFYIHDLTDARLMIYDLGGYWETAFGDGRIKIRLKAGGEVTLVTDRAITGELIGRIERPASTASETGQG